MPEAKRPIYGALSDSAVFEVEFLGQDEQMVSRNVDFDLAVSDASNELVLRGKELRVTLQEELVHWIPNSKRRLRQTARWGNVCSQVLRQEGGFFIAKVCAPAVTTLKIEDA